MRPEGQAATDQVLPRSALRLVDTERGCAAERRSHQRVGDAVGVEPVPGLVQRRPDRLEIVGPVARRQPDVPVRERRAERVLGRVEAPGAVHESERSRAPAPRTPVALGIEGAVEKRGVHLRRGADELRQRRAQGGEDITHLARRHSRLVVVEQRRVRAGRRARSTRCSGASARRSRAGRAETRRSRRCAGLRPTRGGRSRPRASSRPAAPSAPGTPSPSRVA